MIPAAQSTAGLPVAGLFLSDLYQSPEFLGRPRRSDSDVQRQMEGMHRVAEAFVSKPDSFLRELADAAVDLCGADSAGITLEIRDTRGDKALQWVAVSGKFAPFSNAVFPYVNTACGAGIETGRAQWFRMDQPFYDSLSITAEPVTDGVLVPWRTGTVKGTIWIMAHSRSQAFDPADARLAETLANFAAMAMRQKRQQKVLIDQASAAAAASMANQLAHSINNPLQCLTNVVYLAAMENTQSTARELALQMAVDLDRLSTLVKHLLALPVARAGRKVPTSLPAA